MLTVTNPKTFDWSSMSLADCCEGNAADAYFTLKLFDIVSNKLEENGCLTFVEQILPEALDVFSDMEYEGLQVSEAKLKELDRELSNLIVNQEDDLYSYSQVVNTDNLASNNDLTEIFYTREGGFELYPPDKTGSGKPSVSAPTLKLLLEQINSELSRRS